MPKDRRKKGVKGDSHGDEDFLRDLHEELENISEMFDELRRRLPDEQSADSPYVYGFSVRIDPQGRPFVEEFGSISDACPDDIEYPDENEPLTDVIEGESQVTVLIDLPGVDKKDIGIKVEERRLDIKVRAQELGFSKKIPFRFKLKPDTAKASYNNGVLEIKVDRAAKAREGFGLDVKVD